ncbi:MAG: flagellar export chaperone FliS [Deltaproteobacteria bacterium]|nr:flagellar export chaperone FliS [Deltaproteobacteria bacterium]
MNRVNQYQKIQVMTADGVRLIIMLYDGILRFNKCAQLAMSGSDISGRNTNINKSLAIITELSTSLNMEQGGEVARNLARLYDFSTQQLTLANLRNEPALIDSVSKVIAELKSGWEAIATERASNSEHPAKSVSYGI